MLNKSFFIISGSGLQVLSNKKRNKGPPDLLFIILSALTLKNDKKTKKNK